MEDGMRVIGTKGNNMDLGLYTMKKNCLNWGMAYGKLEKESSYLQIKMRLT
jgi:hypothetical protein